MRCVAGIDFSLSCPAMCVHVGDVWHIDNCQFFYLYSVKKWLKNVPKLQSRDFETFTIHEQRLDWITSWFLDILKSFDHPEVFIENYSYTAQSSSTHVLAEGCGLLKHKVWKSNFKLKTLPVTAIKKFASGKGNASKDVMCDAFVNEGTWVCRLLDCLGKSPLADVADAYYISKMGFFQEL